MTEEEKKRQQEAEQDERQQAEQAASSTSVTGTSTNTGSSTNAQGQTQNAGGYQGTGYTPSASVQQAQSLLQQTNNNRPGAYQSRWSDDINGIIDRIMNREPFHYDFNEDALYQQYRDQYLNDSQMAMMDTIGAASALTGGYGNSYAQSVGQQTYQQNMKGLYDMLPELQDMAFDRYNQEGQDLMNRYGILMDQEDTDYGRYMDQWDQWNIDVQNATNWYNTERGYDYGVYRDSTSDRQQAWQNAWAMFQAGHDTPEIRAILGLPAAKVSSGGGGGSSGRSGTGGGDTTGVFDNLTHNGMSKAAATLNTNLQSMGMTKQEARTIVNLEAGKWYQKNGKYK